jgi:hypothetical protein
MTEEYLIWSSESKAFSRSVVESLHDETDFLLSDFDKVALLRKVLANKTIHVFIRRSLPG